MQASSLESQVALARERQEQRLGDAVHRAIDALGRAQAQTGEWPADYGGPLFLLPMYVGVNHVVGTPPSAEQAEEMVRYIQNHQRADGGWGLHVEGHGMVFTSVLNYVALRLLGVAPSSDACIRARDWIGRHGGPTASASWGKFFLALMNLYDYEGIEPILPELWLLPEALPIHPSRLWCHCRMVYLPMSYLYGRRAKATLSPLLRSLREELYGPGGFEATDWRRARSHVGSTDSLAPRTRRWKVVSGVLSRVEPWIGARTKRRAMRHVMEQIRAEDANTDYICIGPINKLYNLLAWHFENPTGREVAEHRRRLPDYLYQAPDGLKMNGYNGSQCWDASFAVQALVACDLPEAAGTLLDRARVFLDANQVREDVAAPEACYRHPSRGGWPFSTRDHGWPISDATAEGLKAMLALGSAGFPELAVDRAREAVEVILSLQNTGGGWATYEPMRGPAWLEAFNPSDCFFGIMVDYPYVECTSACVQALAAVSQRHPEVSSSRVGRAIATGEGFLRQEQRADGSWLGSWGVCFTYGTWFGVNGLLAAGAGHRDPAIVRACEFLLDVQGADGGWGETVKNCETLQYERGVPGQAVMTSWALLTLIAAGCSGHDAVRRGIEFLLSRQRPDGTFPDENIAGVFNRTCGIHYDTYLKVFPLWALGAYRRALYAGKA